jgi:hypothetical protein
MSHPSGLAALHVLFTSEWLFFVLSCTKESQIFLNTHTMTWASWGSNVALLPSSAFKYIAVLLSIECGLESAKCDPSPQALCKKGEAGLEAESAHVVVGLYLTQNILATCTSAATQRGPSGAR